MAWAKNLRLIINPGSENITAYLIINNLKLFVGKKVIAFIPSLV